MWKFDAAGGDEASSATVGMSLLSTNLNLLLGAVLTGFVVHGPLFYHRILGNPDAVIFLFIGQQINSGASAYSDVWDHKGPVLYLLNAASLALGGGRPLAVLVVYCFAIGLALFVLAMTLRNIGALDFSVVSLALFTMTYLVTSSARLTEGWNLFPNTLALLMLSLNVERRRPATTGIVLGLCLGISTGLRANLVALPLVVILITLMTIVVMDRSAGKALLFCLSTAFSMVFVVAGSTLATAGRGGVSDLYDAYVIYNVSYSAASINERIQTLFISWQWLAPSGLGVGALLVWVVVTIRWIKVPSNPLVSARSKVLAAVVVALPIQMLLITASGRAYRHYFALPLVEMAVLLCFGLSWFGDRLKPAIDPKMRYLICLAIIFAASPIPMFWWGREWLAGTNYSNEFSQERAGNFDQVSNAIDEWYETGDTILDWDAFPELNVEFNSAAGTRFAYPLPLQEAPEPLLSEWRSTFACEIAKNVPDFVVEDESRAVSYLPPIDPQLRAAWAGQSVYQPASVLTDVASLIYANYQIVAFGGEPGSSWRLYVPASNPRLEAAVARYC